MKTFLYFAYGSNMLTERLQARCPSAKFAGVAYICGYELRFSKRSIDGSGKATIVESKGSSEKLYGALFEIDSNDLSALDEAEGKGYTRENNFCVFDINNDQKIMTTTYIAEKEEAGLLPYDWYKDLIITGAKQSGLPQGYISQLEKIKSKKDLSAKRESRLAALNILGKADDQNK